MKKKIIIFTLVAVTGLFWMPANGGQTLASEVTNVSVAKISQPGVRRRYYGRRYKNYGQYRREQVGNRRYRVVRNYYWRNNIRLSRYVRIYY